MKESISILFLLPVSRVTAHLKLSAVCHMFWVDASLELAVCCCTVQIYCVQWHVLF